MTALAARLTVPVEHRAEVFAVALALVAGVSGYAARTFQAERVVTVHQVHKLTIQEQYGTPAQTYAGAEINQVLAGYACDAYKRGPTLICHR